MRATLDACPACGAGSVDAVHRRVFRGRVWALARCHACGQHFTSPRPTGDDLRGFYGGDYHAAIRAPGHAEAAFGAKYARYVATLSRHLPRGRVVDVGCGTGLLVRMLRDGGYDAEGVELNASSAAWGREQYGVTIHDRSMERCSFAPASLDAVLLTDVLEHTAQPVAFLRNVRRLLSPRGLVLVTFPDIRSLESRYLGLMARVLRRDWLWSTCHVPLHVWEFTRPTAEACFRAAGFRIAEFRRTQPPPGALPTALLRALAWPGRLLTWAPLAAALGSQMEFVVQKSPDSSDIGPANNR